MALRLLLVFVGAGIGGVLRALLTTWVRDATTSPLPWGTIAVNTIGCFAIGVAAATLAASAIPREGLRLFLVVGVLGGFTTFSAFAIESMTLLRERGLLLAGANLLLANGLGLVGVWLGLRIAELRAAG